MDKLSRDEVLHVAELGRLELSDDEIDRFSYQLKSLFNEIDKINDIDIDTEDVMISPSCNECEVFADKAVSCSYTKKLIDNAPKKFDNFVEIRGVFNE